jgi:hypothetical protein
MNAANPASTNWSFAKKMAFRLFFCFFMFQFLLDPALYIFLFGFNISLYHWFEHLYAPVYSYLNSHVFHLTQTATKLTVNGFLFFITSIVTAVAATVLWSVVDQQRKSYTKADFWLRHFLTYVLAIIIFSYGIDKLIPVQMPLPGTDDLYARAGNLQPSYLFWILIGSHTFYQSFTGLVEIIAVLLLVFPRTHVTGLMVLTITLLNVLMLNISFDIGVTYFVTVLLLAVLYLLSPYLDSILYFLYHHKPGQLYKQPTPGNSKLKQAITSLSAALFIVSALFNTGDSLKNYRKSIKRNATTKVFTVTNQHHGTDSVRMPRDSERWKFWIEYRRKDKDYLSVLTMSDTVSYNLLLQTDTVHHLIRLTPDGQSPDSSSYTFVYKTGSRAGGKILSDSLHEITIEIKPFTSEDWELLKSRNKFFPFDF